MDVAGAEVEERSAAEEPDDEYPLYLTTGRVMLMALFASLFLLRVDEVLRVAVSLALGFGRGG